MLTSSLVACGNVHFVPAKEGPDAAAPAADAPGVDAPAVLPPFSTPVPITELNSDVSQQWPTLTADQLEIYFVSTRLGGTGGYDIWSSKRASTAAMWPMPTPVTSLNTVDSETHLAVSSDGLQLYFERIVAGSTTGGDIYVSVRATRASVWPAPTPVTELNSLGTESGMSISRDGLLFAFDSDRNGASGRDIYLASRPDTTSAWGVPQGVASINTPGAESNPMLVADGLVMWYGEQDGISVTTRASRDDEFGAPSVETDVQWITGDNQTWVSDDQRTLVFRRTIGTSSELYMATR